MAKRNAAASAAAKPVVLPNICDNSNAKKAKASSPEPTPFRELINGQVFVKTLTGA
jgi:hypothetical protein